MADDSLKITTTRILPNIKIQLIEGIYICPFDSLGYRTRVEGQSFSFTASFIKENVPEINAWLAIIVAIVAMTIPTIRNHSGMIE
jgi:hypothetical protein